MLSRMDLVAFLGLASLLYRVGVAGDNIPRNGDLVLANESKLSVEPLTAVSFAKHNRKADEYENELKFKDGRREKKRDKRISTNPDSAAQQSSPSDYRINYPEMSQHQTSNGRSNVPQSFLRYFEVKMNTIIRAQDSRKMGAEYLNETKKPSNDECLIWCWETPKCNVAVFAEKNGGSCYLFDCGPLAEFRCQFTSHGNYKSSILQVPAPNSPMTNGGSSYDFAQWKSQVKHENELSSLRGNSRSSTVAGATIRPTTAALAKQEEEVAPKTDAPAQSPVTIAFEGIPPSNTDKAQSGCKHYQFQCRRSKDCIAIYNVCDGIPQCQDTSDEAEDLHCPKSNDPLETMATKSPPSAAARSTLAPYARVGPAPFPEKPSRPVYPPMARPSLAKPELMEPADEGVRTGARDRMGLSAAYQKELTESRLSGSNGGVSNAGPGLLNGMDKQMDDARSDVANWNSNSYPNMRDQEDYPINRESDGSRYGPAQSSRTFSSKHSSFVAANNNVPYAGNREPPPSSHSSGYSNPRWSSSYNDNGDSASGSRADVPSQARGPAVDIDYNRYEAPLYREPTLNNGAVDSVYRHQLDTADNSGGGPPFRFRNEERYWPAGADSQMPKNSYSVKNDETQMVPADMESRVKSGSLLPSYDSLNPGGRVPYKGQQRSDAGYAGLSAAKPRHQLLVYPDSSGQGRIPHDHGPVVQPQVQNDESPEDAIYEPQAVLPARDTVPPTSHKKIPHRKKENVKDAITSKTTTLPPTLTPSMVATSTSKSAPASGKVVGKVVGGGHHASSVHVNPVPGARGVSRITAESGMTVAELQQSSRIHARESNSAVLALSLGLCVTAVLLVLVGCRMKNIRRRLARRGGRSSLAHDADYLVNGMYL